MKRNRPKQSAPAPASPPAALAERGAASAWPPAPPWWAHALVVAGLLAGSFALYVGSLNLGFLSLDDPDYVQNNPFLQPLNAANLGAILTTPYFANYAPAHLLSYALDVALAGGRSAWAMHLSNVLWYGWVVCMVYVLAFTMRGQCALAAGAAALFLLHPAHVEVVAWISSRKDLIATGFAALSMTCYLLYRRAPRRGAWWYAGSVAGFLLASAGKQSVVLLPAVLLAWDFFVEGRRDWRMLADKAAFGLVTLFFTWMTWHAQPPTNRSPDAFVIAATHFANLWLLSGFGDYVLYRPAPNPAAWSGVGRLAVIAGAAALWLLPLALARFRQGVRAALLAWILIQMVPPMALSFWTPVTDRYLFLPSVGVCLLLADLAAAATARWPAARLPVWTALAVVGALWGAQTANYLGEWRDPRSVWFGAQAKSESPQNFEYLGNIYQDAGIRVNEWLTSGKAPPINDLALARAVQGDAARVEALRAEWTGAASTRTNSTAWRDRLWELAWTQYEGAVARRGTLNTPNLFMRRGMLLVSRGEAARAIPEFERCLRLAETHTFSKVRQENVTHALRAIGVAHWNLRDYKQAQAWLLRAQEVQRKSGQVWVPTLDQEVERIKGLAGSGP